MPEAISLNYFQQWSLKTFQPQPQLSFFIWLIYFASKLFVFILFILFNARDWSPRFCQAHSLTLTSPPANVFAARKLLSHSVCELLALSYVPGFSPGTFVIQWSISIQLIQKEHIREFSQWETSPVAFLAWPHTCVALGEYAFVDIWLCRSVNFASAMAGLCYAEEIRSIVPFPSVSYCTWLKHTGHPVFKSMLWMDACNVRLVLSIAVVLNHPNAVTL